MKLASGTMSVAVTTALLLTTTACSGGEGGGSASSAASPSLVRTPVMSDPPPLDPDTFYQPEGLAIMTAAYQGLLRYKPESTEIEGLLAEEWEVSPDGLTYTFKLRGGVKFSDGTPFDSAAAKASFQRRIDMKGGPAYMLDEVVDMQTPDPQTFIVKLAKPVAPFFDYLASPYGPLMTSPTAVADNESGGDLASGWLASHTAGTGPYKLTEHVPADHYTLEVNENYWGTKPDVTRVEMPLIASAAVQRLKLANGELDMILHGLSKGDYEALATGADTEVVHQPALVKIMVLVNPDSEVFKSEEARAALGAALDQKTLTEVAFGDSATPSTEFLPIGMLPEGAVPDVHQLDPAKLAAVADGGAVEIGFPAGDSSLQELSNQMQVVLQQAGLNATVRDFPLSQMFALTENPDQRPDLFVVSFNPDAAHPDTWARIYNYTNAPVNLLGCSVPEGDKLLDAGSAEPDPAKSQQLYIQAMQAYRDSWCWVNLGDLHNTIAARKGYTGWHSQPAWMWDTDFATLKYQG